MSPETLPTFGARVRASATLRRRRRSRGRSWHDDKWWEERPLETPRDGLYIGKRTISDGYTEVEDTGEGVLYIYNPEQHYTAALVVFSERERPVLVPWSALEPAP
jgi:hypothetical protein